MASAFFLLSLYLQQVRGLSPVRASVVFLLAAPAAVASGPLAGRPIPRFGTRPVLAAGLLTAAAGLSLLSLLGPPLTRIAAARSHHPAVGYPFALRITAVLLLVIALFTMKEKTL